MTNKTVESKEGLKKGFKENDTPVSEKEEKVLKDESKEAVDVVVDTVAKPIKKTTSSFALPSENLVTAAEFDDLFEEDGVIKPKSVKIVKTGSKVNAEFTRDEFNKDSYTSEGVKKKPVEEHNRIENIRRNIGFSWKKFSQKFAVFFLIFGVVAILGVSAGAAFLIDRYNEAPTIDLLNQNFYESSVVYARDGKTELFKFYGEENRKIVSLEEVPEHMQLAVIGLEDENFYYNESGIPWKNIVGAATKCLTGGTCRGGSGLSQQLVKNITGDAERTIDRKINELFTSIKMNEEATHEDILQAYLNVVPFGRNAYGVEMAAKSYFGKSVRDVSVVEACYLAALPQTPSAYMKGIENRNNPDSEFYPYWEELEVRKNSCLDKLHEKKLRGDDVPVFIETEEEFNQYKEEKVNFIDRKDTYKYAHWKDYVTLELKKFLSEKDLQRGGYKIVTTLDPKLQDSVDDIMRANVDRRVFGYGANNISAMVLDGPKGEILAMLGSRNYYNEEIDGQVNIATSPQQPGSTYKPYVYATAFDKGFNPGTVVLDRLTSFGGYKPYNYGGNAGYGLITMRAALQRSLNISTVKTAYFAAGSGKNPDSYTGMKNIMNFTKDLGVEYPFGECEGIASALGTCEVTMVSHVTGYNTFAQQGKKITATPFISITYMDDEGEEVDVYKQKQASDNPPYPVKDKAIDPVIARQITNVLSDNSVRTFGTSNNALNIPNWDVAAKTGTATNGRNQPTDVWTVGYSSQRAVAVWIGNTDNSALNSNATGVGAATPIWNQIMRRAHEGVTKKGFSTEGLIRTSVFCPPKTSGCKTELLTKSQVDKLNSSSSLISKSDYNPYEDNIFDFRNAVIERKVKVNIVDKKLAVEGSLPSQLIEEKKCYHVLSGFPENSGWFSPAKDYQEKSGPTMPKCPTEYSEMEVSETVPVITFTPNSFGSNTEMPPSLTVTAQSVIPSTDISQIVLKVDGVAVASSDSSALTYNPSGSGFVGSKNIQLVVKDSLGLITEKNYENIDFNFPPATLKTSDLASMSVTCDAVVVDEVTNCSFTIPTNRSYPTSDGISIYIGSNITGASCTNSDNDVSCNGVPTSGNTAGDRPIKLQIGASGTKVTTDSTVEITES